MHTRYETIWTHSAMVKHYMYPLLSYFAFFRRYIGYHLSRAMKSGILRQLVDSRVRTVRWHAVLLKRSFISK